jgi:N-acetyl-gamma-glutamylphosphate reductase
MCRRVWSAQSSGMSGGGDAPCVKHADQHAGEDVSIWESDEHSQQLSRLKEMIVDARQDAEKAGVTFIPIVNYPIGWTI